MPAAVREAFAGLPAALRPALEEVRGLIIEVAAAADAGPLTETLKWGEPAYLTEASRSGTTIRLGATRTDPPRGAIYFNCKTSLVDGFRERFADEFSFEGNRALVLPAGAGWSREALAICIGEALTYHRRKSRLRATSSTFVEGPEPPPLTPPLKGEGDDEHDLLSRRSRE